MGYYEEIQGALRFSVSLRGSRTEGGLEPEAFGLHARDMIPHSAVLLRGECRRRRARRPDADRRRGWRCR